MTRRADIQAVEIDGDDAAWLRGHRLPDGVQIAEADEVEFFGAVYDRAPGSLLYAPAHDDVVDRVVARTLAAAPEPPMPVGVDLFCGAGGFSCGMHEAGIDVVAASEWDASAASTYLLNLGHPDCSIHFADDKDERRWKTYIERATQKRRKRNLRDDVGISFDGGWIGSAYRASGGMSGGCRAFMFGDVAKVSGRQIMDAAGVDAVDVVFGGPPCQGLSKANAKACLEDARNALIWEYMRIVDEIRPKSFIIENVPGILTVANGALFNAIAQLANDAGYNVSAQKVDACSYGVPQHRVRALIIGTREDVPGYRFPMPTHWAIGRPINSDGWEMLERNEHIRSLLPAQAHFDRETRRWWFGNHTNPVQGRAGEDQASQTPDDQASLFGEGA